MQQGANHLEGQQDCEPAHKINHHLILKRIDACGSLL